MYYRGYNIEHDRGHVIIKKNNNFISTADDIEEAKCDIDYIINEQENAILAS